MGTSNSLFCESPGAARRANAYLRASPAGKLRASLFLVLLAGLAAGAAPPASTGRNHGGGAAVAAPKAPAGRTVNVSTYRQLRAACQGALPGDTIVLAPGVYTVADGDSRISVPGRPGPVRVKGATGNPADVVIEGRGQDEPAVQMAFDLDDSPRWTFQDLTTRRTYYHGFKFNGSSADCVLRNVVMRDHGESGVKGTSDPARGVYPDRLLVERCDIGFTDAARGGTRGVVEGIDGVGVNDWAVRGSRFVNVVRGGGGTAYAVFTKGNASGTVIDGNRFENCDIGASFGGGGTGLPFFRDKDPAFEHRGGIIRNNVFVRCKDAAVYVNKGRDFKVVNNTLFECGLTIQLRFPASSGEVRNNLVRPSPSRPDEPAVRVRDGATLLAGESNRAAAAGDFVRAVGKDDEIDAHLTRGASAIDAGADVRGVVARDCDGQPRPLGKGYDIGADERAPDGVPVTAAGSKR